MTRLSTVLDPAVLAEADLPTLAKTSGIPLPRLEEISAGADPSIYELGEIAEAVGERPAYLIRPRPAVVARRDSGVDNAAMDRLLESFDRHVSAFRKELGQEPPPSFPVSSGWRARVAGEKWAALHDLAWQGDTDNDPLFHVIEDQLRIPVLVYPVPEAPFGATLLLYDTVAIWVNSQNVPGSHQRFTLAHELGHIMLRHLDVTRIEQTSSPDAAPRVGSPEQRIREEHANNYSGGVLYDRARLLTHWDGEQTPISIARIAAGLGISYEAAIVAVKVHMKEEMPEAETMAHTATPAQAFRSAGLGQYVGWYEGRRSTTRFPRNLERLDLLEQAVARVANG